MKLFYYVEAARVFAQFVRARDPWGLDLIEEFCEVALQHQQPLRYGGLGTWGSALESRSTFSFPHPSVELAIAVAPQLYFTTSFYRSPAITASFYICQSVFGLGDSPTLRAGELFLLATPDYGGPLNMPQHPIASLPRPKAKVHGGNRNRESIYIPSCIWHFVYASNGFYDHESG